jgi:hypothetical protein
LTEKPETARLLSLWSAQPKKWKALIRQSLIKAREIMPLEDAVIRRLLDLLG